MEKEEPRWLSDLEREAWMNLGRVLVKLPAALDAQLLRDAGLTRFEYHCLAALSEVPEATLRMSDLALAAEGSLPRLSQVIGRLERRQWVRRTPDPTDGRYTLAILEEAGREALEAAAPAHVEEVRRLVFDALTQAQVGQLAAIGRRIGAAIDAPG